LNPKLNVKYWAKPYHQMQIPCFCTCKKCLYKFIEVNAGSLGKTVMMKDSQIGKWEKRLEERN
jgi:hypothetical protein